MPDWALSADPQLDPQEDYFLSEMSVSDEKSSPSAYD